MGLFTGRSIIPELTLSTETEHSESGDSLFDSGVVFGPDVNESAPTEAQIDDDVSLLGFSSSSIIE